MRLLTLKSVERGDLSLAVLYENDFKGLRGAGIYKHVPKVPRHVLQEAILGYTRPLITLLGPAPMYLMHSVNQGCAHEKVCVFFDKKDCFLTARNTPSCFQPAGEPSDSAELVRLWREGRYVIEEV